MAGAKIAARPNLPVYDDRNERDEMITNVRARFSEGVLKPLEPLDLREGAEVTVSIENAPSPDRAIRALRATAGAWKGRHDPAELKRVIYQARLTGSREEPVL